LTLESYEAATPRRIEVGLSGGSFGWLNVRAEMSADGGVHAMLRAPGEAAASLRGHAGQMESFLASQASPVSRISFEAGRSSAGAGADAAASGGQRDGAQRQQRAPTAARRQAQSAGVTNTADQANAAEISGVLGGMQSRGMAIATTGGWLSVRA
jgi:hypothetical protein